MIFFMSRAKFEKYVEERCDSIADQYDLPGMSSSCDRLNNDMNRLYSSIRVSDQRYSGKFEEILRFCQKSDADLKRLSERVSLLEQTEAAEKTGDLKAEIEEYAERLKQELRVMAESKADQAAYVSKIESAQSALRKELCMYLEEKIASYVNDITQELERKNAEIQRLNASLYHEKKASAEMIAQIGKQNKKIEELSACVLRLQQELGSLSERVAGLQPPVRERGITPAPAAIAASTPIPIPVPVPTAPGADEQKFPYAVFGADPAENRKILDTYIMRSHELREQMQAMFEGKEEGDIYLKLLDKCIRKLESLMEKNKERTFEADKLANESAKIFKQTIAKAMSQEKLKDSLDRYMAACGIRKLNWCVGKALENEDYDYLEEPILYDEVSDPGQNNTITEIRQDTYIIDYREDDSRYEAVIPGIYSIGKYRN